MNDFVGYIDSEGKIFDGTFDYEGHVGPIGPQGPAGYTPVRGVDYWTEADQNYIVAEATSLINGKIEEYNSNCVAKTSEFDTNASNKTDAFNSNASSKTTEFNNNATSKTGTFNDNVTSKTNDFDGNYLTKIYSFDSNATSKKRDYNDNAVAKMNTFNLNATNKTNAFDGHVDEEFNELTGNFYTKTQIDAFGYGTYSKPSGGIPSTDMSNDVQVSLGKADTAVQDVSGKEDLSNKVTSISGSSTDDQYPSAKLLYDQLALKYNTSDGDLIKKLTESSYDMWELDDGIYQKTRNGKTFLYYNANENPYEFITGSHPILLVYTIDNKKYYMLFYNGGSDLTKMEIFKGFAHSSNGTSIATFDDRYEDLANKVTALTAASTNTEYPSAKCVYDELQAKQAEIDQLYDQIPTATATGETINVQDSSNLPIKEFEALGNATQADTPTPDTPQDIHVVTGDNTVKVLGKNLLKATNGSTTNRGIKGTISNYNELSYTGTASAAYSNFVASFPLKLKADTTYTFSIDNALGGNARLSLYLSGGTSQTITIAENTTSKTFVANGTNTTAYMALSNLTTNTSYSGNVKMQIEVGSTATPYEPYTEQTQLLSLGNIELAKIGDYADRIFKDNGKWYVEKAIDKLVLNGSEDWYTATSVAPNTTRYFCIIDRVMNKGTALDNTVYLMANKLVGLSWTDIYANDTTTENAISNYSGIGSNYQGRIVIRLANSYASTTAQLETWLASNNILTYFVLKTPTTTEITDETLISQLENILAIHTNKNVTNAWIEPSGTNAQAGLTLTYRQDIQTMFNNITTAILSL